MDELGRTANRPYPPPSNVLDVLQRLRSRNLPDRVDADYLRDAGIPDGSIGRTVFALDFLGLVEDGLPTPALRAIGTSTDEEYREILAGLVRDRYREVFNVVDPADDSQERIVNVFRRYMPASQRSRMVTFFLGMCREAGIPVREAPRKRASGASDGRSATNKSVGKTTGSRAARQLFLKDDHGGPSEDAAPTLPAALLSLVQSLPPVGTSLSNERRKKWLNMAEATLVFLYPEESEADSVEDERIADDADL